MEGKGKRNAIVWGASGGIGQKILDKLKAEQWSTIAITRDSRKVAVNADHIFDVRLDEPDHVEQTVYLISQEVDAVDFWCYAAGDILYSKVYEMPPNDWQRILSANLTGAFYAIHYSMPLLSEDAHIIFVGAVSERLRLPGLSAYAASKVGLEAFAEALSKEERKKRITVVRPGAVATPLWDKVPLRLPEDAASPDKVADKILEANRSAHKGLLDLV